MYDSFKSAPLAPAVAGKVAAMLGTDRFACFAVGAVQSLNNDVRLLVVHDGRCLAVRICSARARDDLGVITAEEVAIAEAAGRVGIGPALVAADGDGLLLSAWVNNGRPMTPGSFRAPHRRQAVIDLARRLHDCPAPVGAPVLRTIFERIAALEASLDRLRGPAMPERHREGLARLADSATDQLLVHHDYWPNNVLDDGDRLWLIDWEFSGRGDGMYDLACIAIAWGLDATGERELLVQAGRSPGDHEWLVAMKWVVRYFEASWGRVMAQRGAHATDAAGQSFDYAAHADRMVTLLDA